MFSSHLWPSELIGVHAEQVVHVARGTLRKQLLHLGRKLMGMMIKMCMVIKMVKINSEYCCDHVAFMSKSLPVTSRTETRSLGTGSREHPEAGALYST